MKFTAFIPKVRRLFKNIFAAKCHLTFFSNPYLILKNNKKPRFRAALGVYFSQQAFLLHSLPTSGYFWSGLGHVLGVGGEEEVIVQ